MAQEELTPEQWQTFWGLKEAFPHVSGAAIKAHLGKDLQTITEMLFEGQLPQGDQFIGDSEAPGSGPLRLRATPGPPQQLQQLQQLQQGLEQLRQVVDRNRQEMLRRRQAREAAVAAAEAGAEQPREAGKENDVVSPARKQIKLEVPGPQQQLQRQQPAGDASDDDEQKPFVMEPIQHREKCSVHPCKHRPLVARVFCHGPKRSHTLCVGCCEERAAALRPHSFAVGGDVVDVYSCPIGRCGNTIAARELLAVAAAHAPPLHAALRALRDEANRASEERRQRLLPEHRRRLQAAAAGDGVKAEKAQTPPSGQDQKATLLELLATNKSAEAALQQWRQQKAGAVKTEPSTPVPSRPTSQQGAAGAAGGDAAGAETPRVARRLSQMKKPIYWTPSSRGRGVGDRSLLGDALDDEGGFLKDEEEPVVEDEAAEELRAQAAMVDRERLKTLQACFPATAVGWLVRHADYGMESLIEMVTGGEADPKQRRRADGRGATTIVEETMAARVQFECSVCFCDYDEHLAITCVWLEKRRQTMAPGEVGGPTAEELAAERAEESKGRSVAHKFCADCVRGHAGAAVEQQVIMHAGVGIKCMEPSCKNALLRAHIEQVLDAQTRAILDPLFSNEALLAANCEDVEKCQRCPFAGVMLFTKEQQPIFKCEAPGCRHLHCRKCGRSWYPEHKDRTCEELDPEAVRKRVEEQLTEAAMFKCPRCKRGIVKSDGCNKIACPCGQLSCYVCKAAIENYKHFKNGPAEEHMADKCPLWVDPTARVEAARLDMLQKQIAVAANDATREQLRRLQ